MVINLITSNDSLSHFFEDSLFFPLAFYIPKDCID